MNNDTLTPEQHKTAQRKMFERLLAESTGAMLPKKQSAANKKKADKYRRNLERRGRCPW